MVQAITDTVKKYDGERIPDRKPYHCGYPGGSCFDIVNVTATIRVRVNDARGLLGTVPREVVLCNQHAVKMSNQGRAYNFRKMPPPIFTGVKKSARKKA